MTFTGNGGSLSADACGGKCSRRTGCGADTSGILTFEENDTSISVKAAAVDSCRSWGVYEGGGISVGKNARPDGAPGAKAPKRQEQRLLTR